MQVSVDSAPVPRESQMANRRFRVRMPALPRNGCG